MLGIGTRGNSFLVVVSITAVMSMGSVAQAATVTLIASDAFGASSFNTGTNWSDGLAPHAGGDYFTNENRLRTPPDGNSYTFGGDSFTVNNTNGLVGGLMYKGSGNTGVLTINNLILAGGQVHHQNGTGDLFQLAGNINVTSDSTIHAKQGDIDISAVISGSANLTIPATDAPGETNRRFVNLMAVNSFTGSIDVAGKLGLADSGGLLFVVGASGVNNAITGTGIAVFDGALSFDLSGAGTNLADSWTIANVATQTFGSTFSVAGFLDNGDDTWSTSANGVIYTFDEATGALSVTAIGGNLAPLWMRGRIRRCRYSPAPPT